MIEPVGKKRLTFNTVVTTVDSGFDVTRRLIEMQQELKRQSFAAGSKWDEQKFGLEIDSDPSTYAYKIKMWTDIN